MENAFERLQAARAKAGFKTASDAARFHGWNENTYRSHENGERGLKNKVASKYARSFKVPFLWLLHGEGDTENSSFIFLTGLIGNGGFVDVKLSDEDINTEFCIPFDLPTKAKCFMVNTDSFNPRFSWGDLVFCWDPELYDTKDIPVEALVTIEGKLRFGTLSGSMSDGYRFDPIGAKPMRDVQIENFEPIEATVRRGRYLKDRSSPSSNEPEF